MLTNLLLGLVFVFMAFRIGKSVLLNFGSDLEPVFIFIGLAFLLLIGPLLRWYVEGMTKPDHKVGKYQLLELAPFMLVFLASIFLVEDNLDINDEQVIIIFGSTLIFIYLHFAFYIAVAGWSLNRAKSFYRHALQTKSQKAIFSWLKVLILGFVIIWISYFLNIIEDTVPYIAGPVVYSAVVYFLSYKAFQLKITDIDGDVFKENDDKTLFSKLSELVVREKLYLETDLSLSNLSKLIGKSTQKTSEVINQYAKRNFNDFINHHRVNDAKEKLVDPKSKNLTIASIAFDTGFSSLSSFNSAFKKFEKTTPSEYRKNNQG